MTTTREIGDPERRGVSETIAFAFDPGESGTISAATVITYDDVTNTVLDTNASPTIASGVISSPVPSGLKAEQVVRVHFRYTISGVVYETFRRVVVET
jgi:hypothetical protein